MGLPKKRKTPSKQTDEKIIDLYWKRDEQAIALTASCVVWSGKKWVKG